MQRITFGDPSMSLSRRTGAGVISTNNNLLGTINATSRRNTDNNPEYVSQPVSIKRYRLSEQDEKQISDDRAPPAMSASDNTEIKDAIDEIKDQNVKISTCLKQLTGITNIISNDLNDYKKTTDERIEKLANLFLSVK
jgi:hypothetical protein